jgi:hypothetical protein
LDKAAEKRFSLGVPFQHGPYGVLHLYLFGVPAAAHLVHKRREIFIADLLVYFATLLRVAVADTDLLYPFPATAMPQQHKDVFAFGCQSLRKFTVYHFYTFSHLLVRDIQAFKSLDEDIAQVVIERFLYADDFLFALFREGAFKIFPDQTTPIPYYIINNRVGHIANQIKDA